MSNDKFEARADEIIVWLKSELGTIRTGLATPSLLDGVKVDSYGAKVPINQIGTVTSEDARTLRISVWDTDNINQLEQAIREAGLGLSVVSDESGVRAIFPELTGERREQLLKLAKQKLEEARVRVRKVRDEIKKTIAKDSELSDDAKATAKDKLQTTVMEKNKALEELFSKKETEIST